METEADLPATDKQLLEDARTIPHVAGHVFDQLWFPGYDTHASVSLLDAAARDTIAEHCKQAGRAVPKLVNAGIAVKRGGGHTTNAGQREGPSARDAEPGHPESAHLARGLRGGRGTCGANAFRKAGAFAVRHDNQREQGTPWTAAGNVQGN